MLAFQCLNAEDWPRREDTMAFFSGMRASDYLRTAKQVRMALQ